MKKVGIIMGSDSDLPIVQKAVDMLKSLQIPYEVHIYSAHRTPVEARDFALNARKNGIGVMIATSFLAFDWEMVSDILTDVYQGIRVRHLSGEIKLEK